MVYRGGIREGKRFGKGAEFYNSVTQHVLFRGDYFENFRHGKGIEYEIDETVKSIGCWEFGKRQENTNNIELGSSNVVDWLDTDNKKTINVLNAVGPFCN